MLHKKLFVMVIIIVIASVTIIACDGQDEVDTDSIKTVTDGLGNEVSFKNQPETVVTMMPNLTEIVYALGLEDNILGVSNWCDYPIEAIEKPKVGDAMDLDVEKIVSLEPDIVLMGAGETMGEVQDKLAEMDIDTMVYDPKNIDEILEMIDTLGELFDQTEEAAELLDEFESKHDDLIEKTQEIDEFPSVFLLLDTNSLYTVGDGEFMSEVIELAGANNIASKKDEGYFVLNQEILIEKDPNYIITTFPDTNVLEDMGALSELTAVKEDKVVEVDGDLLSRPGPRIIDGAFELFELLHE
ncbi:ABC transporter substrate-binding protein [Natranaerobius trueperi]|uniref:Fe/B12 periplasmic-binding domain-containing protein n=1 Tax=Natranaerobius trueperi TaxID=759412 RepID=A0A226C2U8_9FIRM|nr:helical backbone metal receptor [Natranaerobius trueperi]OWZ84954.1 hypothetical protein CDO51_00685 [Natranaerobius trueperi]